MTWWNIPTLVANILVIAAAIIALPTPDLSPMDTLALRLFIGGLLLGLSTLFWRLGTM